MQCSQQNNYGKPARPPLFLRCTTKPSERDDTMTQKIGQRIATTVY